jgi:hypothetical protein
MDRLMTGNRKNSHFSGLDCRNKYPLCGWARERIRGKNRLVCDATRRVRRPPDERDTETQIEAQRTPRPIAAISFLHEIPTSGNSTKDVRSFRLDRHRSDFPLWTLGLGTWRRRRYARLAAASNVARMGGGFARVLWCECARAGGGEAASRLTEAHEFPNEVF